MTSKSTRVRWAAVALALLVTGVTGSGGAATAKPVDPADATGRPGPAGGAIAAITTPQEYLADRVAWIEQVPGPGLFKYYCLHLVVSGFGGVPFVSYAGPVAGEEQVEVEYREPGVVGGVFIPGAFTARRLKEAFSDRDHFNLDDRDEISVTIRFTLGVTPPTFVITLHRWGNTVVTFPVLGANDAQIYGNPDSRSHTTMMLTKDVCDGAI
jgi:hypothetical protein